jgi:DNA-binding MltR family transcriptional regulator
MVKNRRVIMTHNENKDSDIDSSIITGKELERYFELKKALFEFAKLFDYDEPNDRAIAIIGAAFLDTLLEHILRAFLVDDEKEVETLLRYDQPLGTYSSRARMTYCLGLINEIIHKDLLYVGKIRNRFAHDLSASFMDHTIKSWCQELQWHKVAFIAVPPGTPSARDLFQVGVNKLVSHLDGVVSIARTQKRKISKGF